MALASRSIPPSYANNFARSKGESAYPHLWDTLVGAWVPALGVTGGTVRDVRWYQRHGTLVNTPTWIPSRNLRVPGFALNFSGGTPAPRVDISHGTLSPFTVIVSAFSSASGSVQELVTNNVDATTLRWHHSASGGPTILVQNTSSQYFTAYDSTALAANSYHTLAGSYDGAATLRFFIDGREGSNSPNAGITGTLKTPSTFILGVHVALSANKLIGDIYVVYFFARALPPQQIAEISADPLAPFRLRQRVWVAGAPLALPQTISPTGIETQEIFGEDALYFTLFANDITTVENFGTHVLKLYTLPTPITTEENVSAPFVNLKVFPDNIVSEETLGNPSLQELLTPSSILTEETFGTSQLDFIVFASSSITEETFGTALLQLYILPSSVNTAESVSTPSLLYIIPQTGIGSGEIFGNHTVASGEIFVVPDGVVSSELIPTPSVVYKITVTGILSEEALGSHFVHFIINPDAIVTEEQFGVALLQYILTLAGIDTLEAFGDVAITTGEIFVTVEAIATEESVQNPSVLYIITPTGITTLEQFGAIDFRFRLYPEDIASAESFGVNKVTKIVNPVSVTTLEAHGNHEVIRSGFIEPEPITSLEDFGDHVVTVGEIFLVLSGIDSSEIFGDASVAGLISPTGIIGGELFGTAQINKFLVGIGGITSKQSLGTPHVKLFMLSVGNILTQELFGAHLIQLYSAPSSVGSLEVFGNATMSFGGIDVSPSSINSLEFFGGHLLNYGIVPNGIESGELFGTAQFNFTLFGNGVGSTEGFGAHFVNFVIIPEAISTQEIIGSPFITFQLGSVGISSVEQFGAVQFIFRLFPGSIETQEIFGATKAVTSLSPSSIGSNEIFGDHTVIPLGFFVKPSGIVSQSSVNSPLILPGEIFINAIASINTEENVSAPNVIRIISPTALSTNELWGSPDILVGVVTLRPTGVISKETFGSIIVSLPAFAAIALRTAKDKLYTLNAKVFNRFIFNAKNRNE